MLRPSRTSPPGLSRALVAACRVLLLLLLLGAAASCDYPGAVSPGPARTCGERPVKCDRQLAEKIGRLALRDLGYGEILRLAYEEGLIRFVKRPRKTAARAVDGSLIAQVEDQTRRRGDLDPAPVKRVPPAQAKLPHERVEDDTEEVAVFTEEAVQRGVVRGTPEKAAAGVLLVPTMEELGLLGAGAEAGGGLVAAEAAAGAAASSAALVTAGLVVIGVIAVAVVVDIATDGAVSDALWDVLERAAGPKLGPRPAPIPTFGPVATPQPQPQPGPRPSATEGPSPPLPRCAVEREEHRGENALANRCADAVPGNQTGYGARVMGVSYDAYQEVEKTLWEIKAHHYSSYSDFLKKVDRDEILRQLEGKKAVAEMCGFKFVVGVIDKDLAKLLNDEGYEVSFLEC